MKALPRISPSLVNRWRSMSNFSKTWGYHTRRKGFSPALIMDMLNHSNLIIALSVNTPYLLLDELVLSLDSQHRDMFFSLLFYRLRPACIMQAAFFIPKTQDMMYN